MGWMKNGPKNNQADFLSINTFLQKPTSFLLDLSVLHYTETHKINQDYLFISQNQGRYLVHPLSFARAVSHHTEFARM